MCGFIAQLVEHRTGIDFFMLLLSNCLNWKINCDDHSSLSSTTAVQIWVISYILPHNTTNCITILITLEATAKIKNWKRKWRQNSLNNHRSIYSWTTFIFVIWKYTIHQEKLARNFDLLPFGFFQKLYKDMKRKFDKLTFISVENISTISATMPNKVIMTAFAWYSGWN